MEATGENNYNDKSEDKAKTNENNPQNYNSPSNTEDNNSENTLRKEVTNIDLVKLIKLDNKELRDIYSSNSNNVEEIDQYIAKLTTNMDDARDRKSVSFAGNQNDNFLSNNVAQNIADCEEAAY